MKYMFHTILLVAGLLLLAPAAASARNCSCTAPDGSYQCSASCPNDGCAAVCSEGGSCLCCCIRSCPLLQSVSLDVKDATVSTVAALLSRTTGRRIEVLSGGDVLVSANLVNVPLGQAIRLLQRGTPGALFSVDGQTVRDVRLSPETQLSVCVEDAQLSAVLAMLSQVTGAQLGAAPSPTVKVTLKTTGTLPEIVARLRAQTGANIEAPN